MLASSTLRSALILASIFVLAYFGQMVLHPLDNGVYDWCQRADHDNRYGGDHFLPSVKLILYSEKTARSIGPWTEQRSRELATFLLSSKAIAAVFHPAGKDELKPPSSEKVLVADGTGMAGDFVPIRDSDGVCRRVALGVKEGSAWKPTLTLRLFARLMKTSEEDIRFLPSAIEVGYRRIETDANYQILVRFRRSSEALSGKTAENAGEQGSTLQQLERIVPIPLENIFNEDFRGAYAKKFAESVILVGTGFKEANSLVSTPLGPLTDFKVNAMALETMVGDWQIRDLTALQKLLLTAVTTILGFVLFARLPIMGIAAAWMLVQIAWLWLCLELFSLGLFVGYTPILVSTTALAVVTAFLKLRQASTALKRFGGAGAYEAAQRGDETVFEEVREKTATIVFTNVLSYLKEMERHGSPNDFFERRQGYAQLLSDVFRKHGGVILDYQGDFQMVGFNVELRSDDPQHAVHAVNACHDFLSKVPQLTRTWWEADDNEIGSAHCGICTGPVACGHVGSRRHDGGRIAQAAIGDTSNVAARLLGAAMKQKEPILLAMTTVAAAEGKILVDELEPIPLKGKSEVVPVARPRGARS